MSLEEVKFCVRCGTPLELLPRAGKERPTCPACNWIYFPDPKVAVAVLIEQDNKVLLARRVMNPQRGSWTLPGGFLDAGEDPQAAAARECLEETNLVVEVGELLALIPGQEHTRGADFVLVYQARITGGELAAGDDADRVAFFARDNFPPLAFKATRQILQSIQKT
jgi:8-oxo-dGTP diphosphatase